MTDMMTETQDLEFIRDYEVSIDRLWRAITDPAELALWFGPEGVDPVECDMNLARGGPWLCVMQNTETREKFKVSGIVTHFRAPTDAEGSVGLTWAWHDDEGKRGPESHVIFEVSAGDVGARLRLIHRDLATIEAAQMHSQGWLSALNKLETFMT